MLTAEDGIESFRQRYLHARTIDRVAVEERVALILVDRLPALDVRVLEHDGLVRLFVCAGYDVRKDPPVPIWRSRYVWTLDGVASLLVALSVPETAASSRARLTEAA